MSTNPADSWVFRWAPTRQTAGWGSAAGGFDPQAVLASFPAVFDPVRHVAQQVDPETACLALLERRGDIGRRRGRWVEWPAIVGQFGGAAFVVDIEAHAKPVRRRHLGKGVG